MTSDHCGGIPMNIYPEKRRKEATDEVMEGHSFSFFSCSQTRKVILDPNQNRETLGRCSTSYPEQLTLVVFLLHSLHKIIAHFEDFRILIKLN